MKKKYRATVTYENCTIEQVREVEADDESEARILLMGGDGECIEESITDHGVNHMDEDELDIEEVIS